MSARGRMWRRIALALLLSALAVAKLEGLIDFGDAAIAVVFAFFMYVSFLGVCRMRGRTRFKPEDDDDAGIDWREKGCVDTEPEMSGGWAVLCRDCAVYEAKEIAGRLEESGVRCRVETIREDRSLSCTGHCYFGNFGMGTRMRILVPPSEYERAKRLVRS